MRLKKEVVKDYTTVHNDFLRDKMLGIKARGILITMLSLPEEWNFSIKGLASILPDGEKSVASALKELELNEYLVRQRIFDDSGKVKDWCYIISDQKLPESVLALSFKAPHTYNGNVDDSFEPHTYFGDVDNAYVDKADVENRHDYQITNKSNTNKLIINKSIYHSGREKLTESDVNDMIDRIKQNIDYDFLIVHYSQIKVDEILMLIVDCITSTSETIKVSGNDVSSEIVRSRFLKLECDHIKYVLESMKNNVTKIKNIKSYLITVLYNSLMTVDSYYSAKANYDMNNIIVK